MVVEMRVKLVLSLDVSIWGYLMILQLILVEAT